jgi:hypothetical protein
VTRRGKVGAGGASTAREPSRIVKLKACVTDPIRPELGEVTVKV